MTSYSEWWEQQVLEVCRQSWARPDLTLEELRARQAAQPVAARDPKPKFRYSSPGVLDINRLDPLDPSNQMSVEQQANAQDQKDIEEYAAEQNVTVRTVKRKGW
jgi:hypothetical protein